jgi:uncharacterized protein
LKPPEAAFAVRINPRAKRTQFAGVIKDGSNAIFKIAVAAPPTDGRANAELIAWLASVLRVPRSAINLASGEHSRNKLVRVQGRTLADIQNALQPDNSAQVS